MKIKSRKANDCRLPSYNGPYNLKLKHNFENTFDIDANDSIVRIDVWTRDDLVNAIRFHLKSDLISELYGMPENLSELPTSLRRKTS